MGKVCNVINKMVSRHLPPGKIASPPPSGIGLASGLGLMLGLGLGGNFRRDQLSYNCLQHEKNRDAKKSKFQKISSIVLNDW